MAKYYVTIEETVHYEVEVEAATKGAAKLLALAMWEVSADPHHDFCGEGKGAEVIYVEKAREPATA